MTIEAAITNLQAKLLSLSGMRSAPDKVVESYVGFPFAVTYERTGRLAAQSSGFGHELVTLYSEIHVSRTLLQAGITQAQTFRDPFLKLLMADPTLGDSVSTINGDVLWSFGVLKWDVTETIGYRFEISVKVLVTV